MNAAPAPTPKTISRFTCLADIVKANVDITLPVCPLVLVQLSRVIENQSNSKLDLADVLSADQALCAQVLRLANSAALGMTKRISSINEAVFRIGYQQIWTMAVAIKSKEMCESSGGKWSSLNQNLWQHSFRVAVFARALAKTVAASQAATLFTAGVLHDLGKWIMYQATPEYASLVKDYGGHGAMLASREQEVIGCNHAKLSGDLLTFWKFPDNLVAFVETHHNLGAEQFTLKTPSHILPMADLLANRMDGIDESKGIDCDALFPQELLTRAGLNPRSLAVMMTEYQRMTALLNKV